MLKMNKSNVLYVLMTWMRIITLNNYNAILHIYFIPHVLLIGLKKKYYLIFN